LRGHRMHFVTDSGVFSSRRVDEGTALLIRKMELPAEGLIVDLGCGYGPLGIAAALLQPRAKVLMTDVNLRAAQLAAMNMRLNVVDNAFVVVADGLSFLKPATASAVLMNPPIRAGNVVVHRLIEESHSALAPGGSLWFVALTRQGAKSLARKMESVFGNVETVAKRSGYRVLRAERQQNR